MTCFHPLSAFRSRVKNGDGKRDIIFNSMKAADHEAIKLPCGQCIGCRIDRSRQWAVRCVHEASQHSKNCFITLTFSPESLACRSNEWSLDVRDWQLFMKRLRKKFGPKIRFYHCGEYGEMCGNCNASIFSCSCGSSVRPVLGRPHYHACIFGFDFPDKELWKVINGQNLYISRSLQELWPHGFSTIGDVTFESAAYVARYIMKKINGGRAEDHYVRYDTGEVLKPEYTTMSRRPGIAREWIDKYVDDVYPHDFVIINGKKYRPPRYYDGILKTERPYTFDEVKHIRECNAERHVDNCTPERLNARELVQLQAFKLLPRNKEF